MKKIIFVISFIAIFGFLFGFSASDAKAATVAELQVLIQQLQVQIATLQQQLAQIQGGQPVTWCHTFNVNLRIGDSGDEVKALQLALHKEGFAPIPYKEGDKNYGNFEDYTASAVVGFQEKYASEVLAPWGLTHGTGYVGPTTRAKLNKLYGCGVVRPYIQVVSPNGGEQWVIGETYSIIWQAKGLNTVNINLGDSAAGRAYGVASKVPASQGKYSWTISSTIPESSTYRIQIGGDYKGSAFDSSDNYFSVVTTGENLPPVIDGLTAPTQLKVNETGTWTIKAHDPENGPLTYSVNWGDKVPVESLGKQDQTTTFTHSYSNTGTYTIEFTVTDDHQKTVKTSTTVEIISGTEETSCSDSDGGKNYYAKGTTERCGKGGCEAVIDVCTNCTGFCEIPGTCGEGCLVVKEYYCENEMIKSIDYACPYGCKDGACKSTASITFISPSGGETWIVGKTYNITWDGGDNVSSFPVYLRGGTLGSSGKYIGGAYASKKVFSWTISSDIAAGSGYYIQFGIAPTMVLGVSKTFTIVSVTTPTTCSALQSNASTNYYFNLCKNAGYDKICFNKYTSVYQGCGKSSYNGCTLYNVNAAQNIWCDTGIETPAITVLSPNGGEEWLMGKTYYITWTSQGMDYPSVFLSIYLWKDNDELAKVIALGVPPSTGKYSWTIPSNLAPGSKYKIRLYAQGIGDTSDNYFSITAVSKYTATFPLVGGWNQISSPITEGITISSIVSQCPNVVSSGVYYWDSAANTYKIESSILKAGVGYNLPHNSTASCLITVMGNPYTISPISLMAGKQYFIGAFSGSVSLDSIIGNCDKNKLTVRFYDSISGQYNPVTTLEPTKAYWIKSEIDCALHP